MILEEALFLAPEWATEVFVKDSLLSKQWYAGDNERYVSLWAPFGTSPIVHLHTEYSLREIAKPTWRKFPVNIQLENE